MIEELHKSIGFDAAAEDPTVDTGGPGTVHTYVELIQAWASLGRVQRRGVGEMIFKKLKKAELVGHSHGLYIDAATNTGFVVVATDVPRAERVQRLRVLGEAAYVSQGLTRVVGMATEAGVGAGRSFDGMILKARQYSPEEERRLREIAALMFGPTQRSRVSEYPNLDEKR
jgi:hypothetical protein